MSSKFSSRPPAFRRPAVCKPPAPPSTQPQPTKPPISTNAYVNYHDLDPLAPWFMVAQFRLRWFANQLRYLGSNRPLGYRLELELLHQLAPDLWHATLHVWTPFVNDEIHKYKNLTIDPSEPFDTGYFGDVNVSHKDYRVLRVME